MKRGFLIILVGVVGALAIWGFSRLDTVDREIGFQALAEITDMHERIDAVIEYTRANPDLPPEYLRRSAGVIANAVEHLREPLAAPALMDSVMAREIPDPVVTPLLGRYHDLVLMDLYTNGTSGRARQADEIARRMLARDDPDGPTLLQAAGIRNAIFRPLAGRGESELPDPWLTLELAEAGLAAGDEPLPWHASQLTESYGTIIGTEQMRRGEESADAFIDSLLVSSPGPDHRYAIHYHRAIASLDTDAGRALESARAVAELMAEHGEVNTLNSLGYGMAERDLAPDVALALCERSLELATTARDSSNVLDSVGWAHYRLGDYDAAAAALEHALELSSGMPTIDDVMVAHLVEVYDAAGRPDAAVELLAPIVARSPEPAEHGGDALLEWVRRAGRDETLDELVDHYRYAGVEPAPAFALEVVDGPGAAGGSSGRSDETGDASSGEPSKDARLTLAGCAGQVLVLNFWGAG